MEESERTARARSFGTVADVYASNRPGYPPEAARWLVPQPQKRVLELGAGTGHLTRALLAAEHHVIATDPAYPMLEHLCAEQGEAAVIQARAEQIPLRSSSVDAVVAAQAFHWFDRDTALPEIARVLRRGGTVALAWNRRDQSVPWVRRLSRLIGGESEEGDPVEQLEQSGLFDGIETATFRHWQQVDRDSLLGLARSRSYVATLTEEERRGVLDRVGALYDDYGRGHDGMLLPYDACCYRARVVSTYTPPEGPVEGLDDGLLIDFS